MGYMNWRYGEIKVGDWIWFWGKFNEVKRFNRKTFHPNAMLLLGFDDTQQYICVPDGWKIRVKIFLDDE